MSTDPFAQTSTEMQADEAFKAFYANQRRSGTPHPEAVRIAQVEAYGDVRGTVPPETEAYREIVRRYAPAPQGAPAAGARGPTGRRMAGNDVAKLLLAALGGVVTGAVLTPEENQQPIVVTRAS